MAQDPSKSFTILMILLANSFRYPFNLLKDRKQKGVFHTLGTQLHTEVVLSLNEL